MREIRDGIVCEEIERRFAATIENLGGVVVPYEPSPEDQDYAADLIAEQVEQDIAEQYERDEYLMTREMV
jgi:hypothetical protein